MTSRSGARAYLRRRYFGLGLAMIAVALVGSIGDIAYGGAVVTDVILGLAFVGLGAVVVWHNRPT